MIESGNKYKSLINAEPIGGEVSTNSYPNGVVITTNGTYAEYEDMCTEIGETVRWSLVDTETDEVVNERLALIETINFSAVHKEPFTIIITLKFYD